MPKSTNLRVMALLFSAVYLLRASGQQDGAPSPDAAPTIFKSSTQLVIVDVVVQSKDGHPIRGLKEEMFRLVEGGLPQEIRHFEEHTNLRTAPSGPTIPQLPAGTFTDYSPVPADETLNVLLLDTLNTPAKDQSYVFSQLREYIKHANPGTRIAIFGLANQLVLLQGFTADPATLKEAIHHNLIPRYSSLLDDPGGSGVDPLTASDVASANVDLTSAAGAASPVAQAAANFQQFEAETSAIQTQMRLQYTLDAFNTLAHYLASFRGRKNLIWFSGSFPLNVLPNPALQNPFTVATLNESEFRDTTNLLTKAQVAVYPVDAGGLTVPAIYNAAGSGRRYGPNPQGANNAQGQFNTSQASQHTTMDTLAESTGGRAFYNTNALADAVSKAIDSGSNYYTLAYSPIDRRQDGGYRKIEVQYSGDDSKAVRLSYRHGYYANDASQRNARQVSAFAAPQTAEGPTTGADAFQRAAMSRGAPAPQDMLFTVRVLPAGSATEATTARDNRLGADVSPKGPFRRYDLDYVALPKGVTWVQQPDGRRKGAMDFLVYVFDVDGKLLNADSTTLNLNLNATDYAKFMRTVVQMHLEISVPARGATFLRVGVRDAGSNHFGVVEIPTSSVSRLPAPVYPGASKVDAGKPQQPE